MASTEVQSLLVGQHGDLITIVRGQQERIELLEEYTEQLGTIVKLMAQSNELRSELITQTNDRINTLEIAVNVLSEMVKPLVRDER